MFRYSMLTLLFVVLVLGLFCAALAKPSDSWRLVIVTLTHVVLVATTLLAVAKRFVLPFAWGFAVAGWAYLVLMFYVGLEASDDFFTTRFVLWAGVEIHGDSPVERTASAYYHWWVVFSNFMYIGHCLWTFIFATIGGLAASWLAKKATPPTTPPKTNLDQN